MSETHSSARGSAAALPPAERKALAVQALAGQAPIASLSRAHGVSRPFVYGQKRKAQAAIDLAFDQPAESDGEVLFYLPVTKAWLRQLALGIILICHGSLRSVVELFGDLLDVDISVGGVHNIVIAAVHKAREAQETETLGNVKVGAHDEIFQSRLPVLVGVDAHSMYCYLLSAETSRDADTWGVRLLELGDKGLNPERVIADAGAGLRAGQELAWGAEVPCDGDVFHALMETGRTASYLENRAWGALTEEQAENRKMQRAKCKGKGNKHSKRLAMAREKTRSAIEVADDLAILAAWLREDIFGYAPLDHATRRSLLDFVIDELRAREPLAPHRIKPVRVMLENQGDALLAFAKQIDQRLEALALGMKLPIGPLRELLSVLAKDPDGLPETSGSRAVLGDDYAQVKTAVRVIIDEVVRASSVVENLNSRLRNYFFLRRSVGSDYLILLRFFLNHRRFMRSECPERVGKSPAELLTGHAHAHWLEMLGFTRFQRAA